MANTYHHKRQKHYRNGYDYGGKYKCNRMYGQSYGSFGRKRAHIEMRNETRNIVNEVLKAVDWDDI